MAKTIITCGVDIKKSTGATGSQGSWRKLPAAILHKLKSILDERGFSAPQTPRSILAIPPTDTLPPPARAEICHHWDKEVSMVGDEDRRKRRLRPTIKFTENTEETDTTHGQNETTTIIIETTATENEP